MNITNYELNKYIEIFKKDKAFQSILKANNVTLTNAKYTEFIELLLINRVRISESSIDDLLSTTPFFLRDEIAEIFEKSFISRELYKNIFYTFKHSSLKKFFSENWKKFFPEYDVLNIESTEQLKLFQKSLMQEFDKFSDIINEMYNIQDVDLVPDEYLSYLAQIIGYEREERELLADSSFRELIKNIIEIYRIKGTNFSFELFFGFLGFESEILEYWFDKRYSADGITQNPFTGSSNENNFDYYLTPIKPTDTIPEGMNIPYAVTENEIVETLGANEFENLLSTNQFTRKQLFGEEPGYRETPYTFFKTNRVEFKLSRFIEGTISDSDDLLEEGELGQGISEQNLRIIELYARFLTPIFISRRISILLFPFEDDASSLILRDDDRADPRATNETINNESMFHLYSGAQPINYYWDDGVRFYKDPINGLFEDQNSRRINPGGHFISGYFRDTYNLIFNPKEPESVYSIIKEENPSWTQKEVYLEISRLIKTKELFSSIEEEDEYSEYDEYDEYGEEEFIFGYGIPSRDLLYPFVDMFFEMYSVQLLENELENYEEDLLIYFNENELVAKMLFFMFNDFEFDFSANYSVLEPYPNNDPANGIFKEAFPGDTKGSIFDLVEKPEDFYNLEHKKFVNQFAGTRNTFHRKTEGKARKFFIFTEDLFIILRNSQNKYKSSGPSEEQKFLAVELTENEELVNITTEDGKLFATEISGISSIFNKNFLLDYIDILGPPEEQKFLAVELTENEELVNITTEDEKLFATEISGISSIW